VAGSDQVDSHELQAQKAEIEALKNEVESNRTNQAERPKLGKEPLKADGRDGDMRFSESGGTMYAHFKVRGHWYKVGLQRG
jgi:hypothetical protein